jgi:hypothetical protein
MDACLAPTTFAYPVLGYIPDRPTMGDLSYETEKP